MKPQNLIPILHSKVVPPSVPPQWEGLGWRQFGTWRFSCLQLRMSYSPIRQQSEADKRLKSYLKLVPTFWYTRLRLRGGELERPWALASGTLAAEMILDVIVTISVNARLARNSNWDTTSNREVRGAYKSRFANTEYVVFNASKTGVIRFANSYWRSASKSSDVKPPGSMGPISWSPMEQISERIGHVFDERRSPFHWR